MMMLSGAIGLAIAATATFAIGIAPMQSIGGKIVPISPETRRFLARTDMPLERWGSVQSRASDSRRQRTRTVTYLNKKGFPTSEMHAKDGRIVLATIFAQMAPKTPTPLRTREDAQRRFARLFGAMGQGATFKYSRVKEVYPRWLKGKEVVRVAVTSGPLSGRIAHFDAATGQLVFYAD